MSLLKLKNIRKEYDGQVVLERLNVSVEEGEFVSIVGASGCGKT
ncbi:lauroyl acyltransferase, partial [Dickeya fangzhongdai]